MPPKTASNSVRVSYEEQGIIFYKDNNKLPQVHLKLSEIVSRYEVNDLNQYKIVQFVRNPYHRFVSSFFFQKKILPKNNNVIFKDYDLETFTKHLLDSKKTNTFIESFYGETNFVYNSINNGISWGGTRFYETQRSWNDLNGNVEYKKIEDISQTLQTINSQNLDINYLDLITPGIKEMVIELFEEDFDIFDYKK